MPIRPLSLGFLALLCAGACATGPGRGTARILPTAAIDAAELRGTDASNLYDAISRLRPAFLATRGATSFINEPENAIVVVIDRTIRGGVSALRDIDPKIVRSIRRLSAADVFQITGRSAPSGGVEVSFAPQ